MVLFGQCASKSIQYRTGWTAFTPPTLNTTEAAIWHHDVPAGQLVAAVFEFDVTANLDTTLQLRTSIGSAGFSDAVLDPTPGPRHIRGWWPYSTITFDVTPAVETDPYDIFGPAFVWCPICETYSPGGTPIVPPELKTTTFGHQPGDTYGFPATGTLTGNIGLYGAIVKYKFHLKNTGSQTGSASIFLISRNIPDDAYGACNIESPGTYEKWMVPPLFYDPIDVFCTYCSLVEESSGVVPIAVGPGLDVYPFVAFCAGGGSGLPANLEAVSPRSS